MTSGLAAIAASNAAATVSGVSWCDVDLNVQPSAFAAASTPT